LVALEKIELNTAGSGKEGKGRWVGLYIWQYCLRGSPTLQSLSHFLSLFRTDDVTAISLRLFNYNFDVFLLIYKIIFFILKLSNFGLFFY
jgi:hypothetical protein